VGEGSTPKQISHNELSSVNINRSCQVGNKIMTNFIMSVVYKTDSHIQFVAEVIKEINLSLGAKLVKTSSNRQIEIIFQCFFLAPKLATQTFFDNKQFIKLQEVRKQCKCNHFHPTFPLKHLQCTKSQVRFL
jgi:hypothetical protein